jgi:hypothetical protein
MVPKSLVEALPGRIVLAAVVGAVVGLAGTMLALNSLGAGILGGVGGAIVAMIATLVCAEKAEI